MSDGKKTSYVIGVAGGTGSGKTTVVRKIVEAVDGENAVVLHHDSYYRDRSELPLEERVRMNYDHPDALETELLSSHIEALLAQCPVDMPVYDFANHRRLEKTETLPPRPVVIVEGFLVLAEPDLRRHMDLKVFVDTDPDLRFIRRMQRDVAERGRSHDSVVNQYLANVKPMHDLFVEPSKRYADIIVPEGGFNTAAIGVLVAKIRSFITEFGL